MFVYFASYKILLSYRIHKIKQKVFNLFSWLNFLQNSSQVGKQII